METTFFNNLMKNTTTDLILLREKVTKIITSHPKTIRHDLYSALAIQTGESIDTIYMIDSLVKAQGLLLEA